MKAIANLDVSEKQDNGEGLLHVHDLPQLWQKPSPQSLIEVLHCLSLAPVSFQDTDVGGPELRAAIAESGIPAYLTSIVASKLAWIENDATRESIWDLASMRLSERSGRTGMPAMTRDFAVSKDLTIKLHEPSLTGDNLGLKTWASSLLLSKQLTRLADHLPNVKSNVLELGAGTGLVGISAACLWQTSVLLTDLPEIVPNLEHNLALNEDIIRDRNGLVAARTIDWSDTTYGPSCEGERFTIIVAADPIYSPEHPKMLVDTIDRWLKTNDESRVVIELPRRHHYVEERDRLRKYLEEASFQLVMDGLETGFDDWVDEDGKRAHVECEFSVWRRDEAHS